MPLLYSSFALNAASSNSRSSRRANYLHCFVWVNGLVLLALLLCFLQSVLDPGQRHRRCGTDALAACNTVAVCELISILSLWLASSVRILGSIETLRPRKLVRRERGRPP
jgi:hypothetical protein